MRGVGVGKRREEEKKKRKEEKRRLDCPSLFEGASQPMARNLRKRAIRKEKKREDQDHLPDPHQGWKKRGEWADLWRG